MAKKEKAPQMSPDFPDSFYRISVKGLCVRDGKVLLIEDYTGRSDIDPRKEWELPGGGVDFGESFHQALKREVKEEMGLEVSWIDEKPTYIWTVKRTNGRGMEWFYVCTVLFRFDFVDLNFTPTRECRDIRFFSKEDLKNELDNLGAQVKPLAEHFEPTQFKNI